MFDALVDKINAAVGRFRGRGLAEQKDIDAFLRDIKFALLQADVDFNLVSKIVAELKENISSGALEHTFNPAQALSSMLAQTIKKLLGNTPKSIGFSPSMPTVYVLVGLEGSGKTTVAAKLARVLRRDGRKVSVATVDTKRAAADQQLGRLAGQANCVYIRTDGSQLERATYALEQSRTLGSDVLILDTPGISSMESSEFTALRKIQDKIKPFKTILVLDSMAGQSAVRAASEFAEHLGVDGVIVTKLDSDARGGAVLSISAITGLPIYYASFGERLEDFQVFDPRMIAYRLVVPLASGSLDPEAARKGTKALLDMTESRSIDPLIEILNSIEDIDYGMMSRLLPKNVANMLNYLKENKKYFVAIYNSMTPQERQDPRLMDASRRKRVARGSGTTVEQVNMLLKLYTAVEITTHGGKSKGVIKEMMKMAKISGGM
jgi:signal recognition particle subunit SRP54